MQTLETASPPTAPVLDAPPARRWRPSAPGRASMVATVLVWTPMLVWYAAFRPGLMSSDSITVYSYAVHGGWVDYHPPAYIAAMWVSTSVLGSPSLLTLAQSLLLAAAIVAVARSLLRLGVHRFAVYGATAVVAILPTVGAFSISLWKDVPYAAAFLFLGARVIDLTRARLVADTDVARSAAWSICCWSCLAVVMRQNGILLVSGLVVVLWIVSKAQRRQMLAVLVIPVALLLVLKVVVYPVMGVASSGAQPPLELQLHDIADAAARHPAMFTDADRAFLDTMAPFDVWATSYAGFGCWSAAWQWDSRFDWSKLDGHAARLVSLWLKVVREQPAMVARNRVCVGEVAFRPDNDGLLYTVSRGVYGNSDGLRTVPISGTLHERAVSVLDRLDENDVQSWAWRAPGWIYLADLVFVLVALRRRRWFLLLPLLPLAMLQLAVFVVNPAQDARYMFPGLIFAMLLLSGVTLAFPARDMQHAQEPLPIR